MLIQNGNSLNAKLLNSQLNKLKSAIKNETEAVLSLSSNMICNLIDETNFLLKLLLRAEQTPYNGLLKNTNFSIKTTNDQVTAYIIKKTIYCYFE